MQTRETAIINKLGLHARAAAKFVTLASTYASDIQLKTDSRQVNGKSIMGVLMLAAAKGTVLNITTEGPDEESAMTGLVELIENRFDEEE